MQVTVWNLAKICRGIMDPHQNTVTRAKKKKHEAASETQCIVRVKHVEPLRYFAAGSAFAP